MIKPFLYRNFFLILMADTVLVALSLYLANLVRFEFAVPEEHLRIFWRILPLCVVVKPVVFFFFDLYRGMWRYTSISDLLNLIKAAVLGSLLIFLFILFGPVRFLGFSRSVLVLDLFFTVLLIGGLRLAVRIYFDQAGKPRRLPDRVRSALRLVAKPSTTGSNLLIIGAGDAGEKMCREIRDNARLAYNVIGFLDDDPAKIGRKIHGIPVVGEIAGIRTVAARIGADEALIAIPSADAGQMRAIVEHCKNSGISFKTIPSYGELLNGKVSLSSIREVDFRDLIGREVIELDREKIGSYLHGQTVLVTGAGGSIGSELCRQIVRFSPGAMILFERAESPLYDIDLELRRIAPNVRIIPLLSDVQNRRQVDTAFSEHRPATVFHAAAYKHVPMLEQQPWMAVENNIMGTKNVVETAHQFEVERFVMVSTDKAVRPTNVMGASKRVAEMFVQSQNGCGMSSTRFMTVRFGNVVGSVGSVVPLFKQQIARGGPVTVTHPEVTRFFMTIPEACQLILQAGAMGRGGEIFLLDMGTPIRILEMAKDLIRLSGLVPEKDIPIEFIGLRPGEKLYEELSGEGEDAIPSGHEKIMVLNALACDFRLLSDGIDELARLAEAREGDPIRKLLQPLVPEYRPSDNSSENSGGNGR